MAVLPKVGSRFRSVTCRTEVVVVKAPTSRGRPALRRGPDGPGGGARWRDGHADRAVRRRHARRQALRHRGRSARGAVHQSRRRVAGCRRRAPRGQAGRSRSPRRTEVDDAPRDDPGDGGGGHGRSGRDRVARPRASPGRTWPVRRGGRPRCWPRRRATTWCSSTRTRRPSRWPCSARRSPASPSCRSTTASPTTGCVTIVARVEPATVIAGADVAERLGSGPARRRPRGVPRVDGGRARSAESDGWGCDPDAVAVLLFTSGTTGEPKAAVLRHRNLASYVVGSLEFARRGGGRGRRRQRPAVPHSCGVVGAVDQPTSGRRVVQLERFEPDAWVQAVRAEHVTHAMVVPTMLNRILDVIEADGGGLPSLALAGLRRRADASAGRRAGAGAARRRRPGQRLRAHRDVQHDRRARPRRPSPGRVRQRRPGRPRPARVGGPALPASSSVRTPRRPSRPASGRDLGAGRAGVGRVPRHGRGTRRGLVPRPGTPAASTPTASSTSRAGSTTSSSGAARTCRPARSRPSCSNIRRVADGGRRRRARHGVGRAGGGRGGAGARPQPTTRTELQAHVRAAAALGPHARTHRDPGRAALQRDRQVAPSGRVKEALQR